MRLGRKPNNADRYFRLSLSVSVLLMVCAGCATGTTIMNSRESSRVRQPVKPENVQVHFQYPPLAEEIAIVTESAGGKGQKATDKTLKKLKERAGAIGANGIVLESRNQSKGFITYGAWIIPQDEVTISARAVYVP